MGVLSSFVARYRCPLALHPLFWEGKFLKDAKGNIVVVPTYLSMLCTALRFIHRSASSMKSDQPFIPSCSLHAFSDSFPCYLLNRLVPSILTFVTSTTLVYIDPLNDLCNYESLTLPCSFRYYCPFPTLSSNTMGRVSS
jgi:hypothetical protein